MSSITDYLLVFAIGGAICVIGQLLMSLTRLTPARILVIFVTAGVQKRTRKALRRTV